MVFPDLPLEEYRVCTFQLWGSKEVIHPVLSLVYGTFIPLSTAYPPASNPFLVEDVLALFIIVYYTKRYGGLARVGGMPSLLDKIRQDATTYFLILSTGHLLFLFFEIFTPVSDLLVDLRSAAHDRPHVDFD